MNDSRHATTVGLFVLIGLGVLGALLAAFSKSSGLLSHTYELKLRANNVSGLKQGSVVLMSGVHVGRVQRAEFAPDGRGVIIRVQIDKKYPVHADARFVIEQLGLLGDQYAAIYPRGNKAPVLADGDQVPIEEPFNFQETIRSATQLIGEFEQTAKTINTMMARLDKTLLSDSSLANATNAIAHFQQLSEHVLTTVDHLNQLLETNSRPIFLSVSNLVQFSGAMDLLAGELSQMVATNKVDFNKAIQSLGPPRACWSVCRPRSKKATGWRARWSKTHA